MSDEFIIEITQNEYIIKTEQGIPGKSAYETAVFNGFVGTEPEWLLSIGGEGGISQVQADYAQTDSDAADFIKNKPTLVDTNDSRFSDARAPLTHTHPYEPADSNIQSHISSTSNPHSVTATQIGLSNVDNTSDVNKPVSSATQTALNLKADSSVIGDIQSALTAILGV